MSEMVERVARAIRAKVNDGPVDATWDDVARAAIAELRKTDILIEDAIQGVLAKYVLEDGQSTVSREEAAEIWNKMLDVITR